MSPRDVVNRMSAAELGFAVKGLERRAEEMAAAVALGMAPSLLSETLEALMAAREALARLRGET